MGTFLFLFMASPLIKEQGLSDHNNYYEITSQTQIMALRDKALFRGVQSCKCILIKCCGKKTVLARGLVVRRIYWRKFPTSFQGSLLFTSQGAREGRPWLGLVMCLPEKNYSQGGVLHLLFFVKIYCPLRNKTSALLCEAHAKLIQLAMFFSSLHFASHCNINLKA